MRLVVREISVNGRHQPLVPPTSLTAESGSVTYVAGYPGVGCTALALAITGRIAPSGGSVELHDARGSLQDASAVVDSPDVTAPDDEMIVRDVVAESLALAGRRSGRKATAQWLRAHDVDDIGGDPLEIVSPTARTALLCALAADRDEVELVVLDCPDRFGGNPRDWHAIAASYADAGLAIVVLCDRRSVELLGVPAYAIGTSTDSSRSDS